MAAITPTPAPVAGPSVPMAILKPILAGVIGEVITIIEGDKTQIMAQAQALGVSAVDAVEAFILQMIPKNGIFSLIQGPLSSAIKAAVPTAINALGGDEAALFTLLDGELKAYQASLLQG